MQKMPTTTTTTEATLDCSLASLFQVLVRLKCQRVCIREDSGGQHWLLLDFPHHSKSDDVVAALSQIVTLPSRQAAATQQQQQQQQRLLLLQCPRLLHSFDSQGSRSTRGEAPASAITAFILMPECLVDDNDEGASSSNNNANNTNNRTSTWEQVVDESPFLLSPSVLPLLRQYFSLVASCSSNSNDPRDGVLTSFIVSSSHFPCPDQHQWVLGGGDHSILCASRDTSSFASHGSAARVWACLDAPEVGTPPLVLSLREYAQLSFPDTFLVTDEKALTAVVAWFFRNDACTNRAPNIALVVVWVRGFLNSRQLEEQQQEQKEAAATRRRRTRSSSSKSKKAGGVVAAAAAAAASGELFSSQPVAQLAPSSQILVASSQQQQSQFSNASSSSSSSNYTQHQQSSLLLRVSQSQTQQQIAAADVPVSVSQQQQHPSTRGAPNTQEVPASNNHKNAKSKSSGAKPTPLRAEQVVDVLLAVLVVVKRRSAVADAAQDRRRFSFAEPCSDETAEQIKQIIQENNDNNNNNKQQQQCLPRPDVGSLSVIFSHDGALVRSSRDDANKLLESIRWAAATPCPFVVPRPRANQKEEEKEQQQPRLLHSIPALGLGTCAASLPCPAAFRNVTLVVDLRRRQQKEQQESTALFAAAACAAETALRNIAARNAAPFFPPTPANSQTNNNSQNTSSASTTTAAIVPAAASKKRAMTAALAPSMIQSVCNMATRSTDGNFKRQLCRIVGLLPMPEQQQQQQQKNDDDEDPFAAALRAAPPLLQEPIPADSVIKTALETFLIPTP